MAFKIGDLVVNKSNELSMTVHGFYTYRTEHIGNISTTPAEWVVCKYLDGTKWVQEVFHEAELELEEDIE